MTQEHIELIKLQIELFELFPYSFDVSEITLEQFELSAIVENFISYIKDTDFGEIKEEEMELLDKVRVQFLELDLEFVKTDKVYLERYEFEIEFESEDTSWCLQYELIEDAKKEFNRLKRIIEKTGGV